MPEASTDASSQALYDNAYEDDQISLIQSVILLGFWYTDAEDRFEAWHWIGIAISLSQTMGLHRSPGLVKANHRLPDSRQRLFRRIWWSCFVRDRWLSLVKGRPMRINLDDCDLPLPDVQDLALETRAIPTAARERYMPCDPACLGQRWCKLVNISVALGNILNLHGRKGVKAALRDIERCESELAQCEMMPVGHEIDASDPRTRLFTCQLRLFYE